jgi:hypothetical protein
VGEGWAGGGGQPLLGPSLALLLRPLPHQARHLLRKGGRAARLLLWAHQHGLQVGEQLQRLRLLDQVGRLGEPLQPGDLALSQQVAQGTRQEAVRQGRLLQGGQRVGEGRGGGGGGRAGAAEGVEGGESEGGGVGVEARLLSRAGVGGAGGAQRGPGGAQRGPGPGALRGRGGRPGLLAAGRVMSRPWK